MNSFVANVNKLALHLSAENITTYETIVTNVTDILNVADNLNNIQSVLASMNKITNLLNYMTEIQLVSANMTGLNAIVRDIIPNLNAIMSAYTTDMGLITDPVIE